MMKAASPKCLSVFRVADGRSRVAIDGGSPSKMFLFVFDRYSAVTQYSRTAADRFLEVVRCRVEQVKQTYCVARRYDARL